MGWYTSEQAFACKSATGSTDPLPRMRNASRIGCSERSLAAVAKLYGALRAAREWGSRGVPARGMHASGPRTNEINADTAHMPKGRKAADNGGARQVYSTKPVAPEGARATVLHPLPTPSPSRRARSEERKAHPRGLEGATVPQTLLEAMQSRVYASPAAEGGGRTISAGILSLVGGVHMHAQRE